MPLIEHPWTRVRDPRPIPTHLTKLPELNDVEFAELIRSNLNPRTSSKRSAEYIAWNQLWEALRADDGLAERTYDVLEEFEEQTEVALDQGDLDDAGRKRAEKFLRACGAMWQRIDREPPARPLEWAGDAGNFPPRARHVIAQFVSALASHRASVLHSGRRPTPEEEELWGVMSQVGLDPQDYPQLPGKR